MFLAAGSVKEDEMADSSLIQVIQRIVKQTVEAEKPCDYIVGLVTAVDPLEIKISNNLTIDEEFVDVCENLTDRGIEIDITTETEPYPSETPNHKHDIKLTKKKITIHNALKVNDKVAMLRRSRGQKFLIIDKVVSGE